MADYSEELTEVITLVVAQTLYTNHIYLNDNIVLDSIIGNYGAAPVQPGITMMVEDSAGLWINADDMLGVEWEDPPNEFSKTPKFKVVLKNDDPKQEA